ncbi:MAG: Xaa-Pro peptidase family protein [Nitrospirota bacterium]
MIKIPVTHYSSKLIEVRESLKRRKVDGFLVNDINNVRYLTGFSGSSGFLLITKKDNIFITDFRYKEQAEKEIEGWDIIISKEGIIKAIKILSKNRGIKRLGIESSVSYDFFKRLSSISPGLKIFKGLIEKLREVKDVFEIGLIKEAVKRAESAFLEVKPYIKQGVKERTIALRLEETLKKKGCRRILFDIIVASGPNSAMPHARPTERRLREGELLILDWGGEAEGFYSDMTRTFIMKGNKVGKKGEIFRFVLEANKKAISVVSPGVQSEIIDRAARDVIKKAGYGDFFGHGTGHGVGLQVHEAPYITHHRRKIIKENMIFTIEPGIYVPELGGVRIEDMVVVRSRGSEVLTSLPKNLEII